MASPIAINNRLKDSSWLRNNFMVDTNKLDPVINANRFLTSASLKYVDTSPGGNLAVNPLPQFTRLADIRPRSARSPKNVRGPSLSNDGGISRESFSTTMGRYYSEAIDDNQHLVHFRMGKTGYNSFFNFLSGYFSFYAAYHARTGRAPGIFHTFGKVIGVIVAVTLAPITILAAVGVVYKTLKLAQNIPRSKFAYLKPTMPLYWQAVQTMVNHIATYMGIVTLGANEIDQSKIEFRTTTVDAEGNSKESKSKLSQVWQTFDYSNDTRKRWSEVVPDIFDSSGNLNVYAYATKAQRMANRHRKMMVEQIDSTAGNKNMPSQILGILAKQPEKYTYKTYQQYQKDWQETGGATLSEGISLMQGDTLEDLRQSKNTSKFSEFLEAEMNDGAAFVTFRVEEGGSISESFSNSASDSPLKTTLDGMASQVRGVTELMAGGKVVDGPIGSLFDGVKNIATQLIGGGLDMLGLGGLAGVLGGGYADIPQHWDSSSANMPKASYTIKLNRVYENPYSKLVHEVVPLSMALCMVLPHSTGTQSYTGPFMLEFYDKGRTQCRYGMIDSMTVTRGTASTPFSQSRDARGIEISMSILDLTSIMHMPLTEGYGYGDGLTGSITSNLAGMFGLAGMSADGAGAGAASDAANAAAGATGVVGGALNWISNLFNFAGDLFTDDTNFTDYMSILASMDLMDNIYVSRKLRHKLIRHSANWRTHYSTPALAAWAGDSMAMQVPRAFMHGAAMADFNAR